MDTRDKESQELIKQFENQEAGVADLAVLYERIESVYIQASQTSQEEPPISVSNSTNPTR
jgi:hypothetical protein